MTRLRGPIRPGPATPSEPGFVYHATNEERACDIVRDGKLKTHKPWEGTEQDTWPDGSVQKRSYHAEKADVVHSFAPEEGAPVILRTARTAHPFQRENTGDIFTTKPIPAKKLEIGLDEGWMPLQDWAKRECK